MLPDYRWLQQLYSPVLFLVIEVLGVAAACAAVLERKERKSAGLGLGFLSFPLDILISSAAASDSDGIHKFGSKGASMLLSRALPSTSVLAPRLPPLAFFSLCNRRTTVALSTGPSYSLARSRWFASAGKSSQTALPAEEYFATKSSCRAAGIVGMVYLRRDRKSISHFGARPAKCWKVYLVQCSRAHSGLCPVLLLY
jgi:hypothetical protein